MRRRKNKKNYAGIIVSIFIAFILVTSIIGYIFGDNQNQVSRYKDLKFTATSQGWKTNYQGKTYHFSFLPQDLEDINISDSIGFGNLLEVDATYEPNSTYKENIAQAIFELKNILGQKEIFLRQGFTRNSTFNLPIITCSNANPIVPVIYYKSSNQTLITNQAGCIIIESQSENSFLALTDKGAYRILGIV